MNIIVKQTPSWRPNQPEESYFKSRARDGKTVYRNARVEDQFSKEELEKIQKAIHLTNAMGNPSIADGPGDVEQLPEGGRIII